MASLSAHSRARPFKCDWQSCGKSFPSRSAHARHYRSHTNDRPFSCSFPECGKAFIQRHALDVHTRTHTGERPYQCSYLGCGKRFGDPSTLKRHDFVHARERPYKCANAECNKSFIRKTSLANHAKRCVFAQSTPTGVYQNRNEGFDAPFVPEGSHTHRETLAIQAQAPSAPESHALFTPYYTYAALDQFFATGLAYEGFGALNGYQNTEFEADPPVIPGAYTCEMEPVIGQGSLGRATAMSMGEASPTEGSAPSVCTAYSTSGMQGSARYAVAPRPELGSVPFTYETAHHDQSFVPLKPELWYQYEAQFIFHP